MRLFTIVAVVLLLACDSTAPSQDLGALVSNGNLVLANRSGADVYYFVADQDFLALADRAPTSRALTDFAICETPESCAGVRIPPHSAKEIALSSIPGYNANSKTISVSQWRIEPNGADGYNRVDARTFTVKVR